MKKRFMIAVSYAMLSATIAFAAQPEFLVGEGVKASPHMDGKWVKNCIVQSAPNRQKLYEVKCKDEITEISAEWMVSNPDQTATSRTFVCPGGGKPCYFKP